MANPQDIRTNLNGDYQTDYDEQFSPTGCGCYKLFFCCSGRKSNGTEGYLMQRSGGETWLGEKFKEVKQASEVIAGPKWKNLIRKVGGYVNGKKQNRNVVLYDSDSYALNFDEGEDEDDVLLTGFSARYAPPVTDEKRQNGL